MNPKEKPAGGSGPGAGITVVERQQQDSAEQTATDTQRRIADFLHVLARTKPAGQRLWIAQVQDLNGGDWRGDSAKPPFWHDDWNLYFSCASMLPSATTRNKKNFGALLCVVLDDIGTKVPLDAPRPDPSWIIETSPGNFQYGYLLQPAVTDERIATRLIGGLVEKGYTDAGADGIVRYFRLPGGVNTKSGWTVKAAAIELERRYKAEELAGAFRIDLMRGPGRRRVDVEDIGAERDPIYSALQALDRFNGTHGPGGYGMTCFWEHEHTGGKSVGTSTAYKPGGLWNCAHQHCRHRRLSDVLEYMREEYGIDTDALVRDMPGLPGKLLRAARRYVYVLKVGEFADLETGDFVEKVALDDYYFNVAQGFARLLLQRDDLLRVEHPTYRPGAAQVLDEAGRLAVNQWRPSNVQPAAAADEPRVKLWLEHLEWLFPEQADWLLVLDFLTHLVQRRGDKINWGLVLVGQRQGLGRDTLVTPIRNIIGQRNVAYIGARQIESQFNDYLVSELLSISELDTTEASRWQMYQRLKDALTTPPDFVEINAKYVPEHKMPKVANVLLITNDAAALALPDVDRRFGVVETQREKEEVAAYKASGVFHRLHAAYAEPGWLENFYAFLLARKISPTFDAKGDAPATPAKLKMMRAAEHPGKSQIRDWITKREEPLDHDLFEARAVFETLIREQIHVEERLVHAFLRDLGAEYVGRITDHDIKRRLWAVRNVALYKTKAQQPGALAAAYHAQRRRGSIVMDLLS